MSSPTGIIAMGAYVPRRRLQRSAIQSAHHWFAPTLKGLAKGEKAIANWDEDSITMAVEAARDCLTGFDRTEINALTLASTTLLFADRLNAGVVKEALNLNDSIAAQDATGSQRAGTSALLQALHDSTTRLCVAAERRKARPASEAELIQGDAAAALLIGQGELIARCLGAHSVTVDFVDHFRASGEEFDYGWESRWVRDEGYLKILGSAVNDALSKLDISSDSIDRTLISAPVRGLPERLAKQCGFRAETVADTLISTIGDSGAAHPLLMLAAALENAQAGEKILLASFGQGADVMVFEATESINRLTPRLGVAGHLSRRRVDDNYMRFLFHRGLIDNDRGMRAEFDEKQPGTTLYRNRKTVLGLIGSRGTTSGTIQFPKSEISVNSTAGSQETQEDYPLADRAARIVTYTADRLTYSPDPPLYYGMLDFDGGGRLVAEFTDVEAEVVEVGRQMRMMFRIKAIDDRRGFTKYFWKATPASEGAA